MILKNSFLYLAGIAFLTLSKLKNMFQGYKSPKPFDMSHTSKCIDYDIHVVNEWLNHINKYTNNSYTIAGKNVLELGPGSDLGVGLCLLAKGCAQYNAIDVNNLMYETPEKFYNQLFSKLENMNIQKDIINILKAQLAKIKGGRESRLRYVVDKNFDIVAAFGKSNIDLVFSQAAFEHFNDIEKTISQLSEVCKDGALLVAEIDLKTHSRWIRDVDPNNIYRYSNYVYNLFCVPGTPNRYRPYQYKEVLARFGWSNISIVPLNKLNYKIIAYSGMHKNYSAEINQMDYLSIMLCATKRC
ncbi:MAG TPA: methyltransferase domain-containing protein [Deltaproteobacteria bacterium]|nr:methyltransferase domain-containing protein [Deltaproteobacteria bacterium]